jgi:hypothetical protein
MKFLNLIILIFIIFLLQNICFADKDINIDWGKWNTSSDKKEIEYNYEQYLFELDKSNLQDYKSQYIKQDFDDINMDQMEIDQLNGL